MPKQIFISCVSAEFKSLREDLRFYLTRADCEVKVQEEFRQTEVDTVEKLDEYIRTCQAVIHLVGQQPGAKANQQAVRSFLDEVPHFGESLPEELQERLGDFSDLTYTQWEAFLALHHKVPLFVYRTADAEQAAAQQEHLQRLAPAVGSVRWACR